MKTYIGTKKIQAEPQPGSNGEPGYKVVYKDGYESWSPKDVFEEAYSDAGNLDFGAALHLLKEGHKVARRGWNGKGIHIEVQRTDENSKMTTPYIFIDTTGLYTENNAAPKCRVPWLASQTDMLANDWCIVD